MIYDVQYLHCAGICPEKTILTLAHGRNSAGTDQLVWPSAVELDPLQFTIPNCLVFEHAFVRSLYSHVTNSDTGEGVV